jgi:hypothetical protein
MLVFMMLSAVSFRGLIDLCQINGKFIKDMGLSRHSGLDTESSAFIGFFLDSRFRGNDEP